MSNTKPLTIGTPVIQSDAANYRRGYISSIEENTRNVVTIGASGITRGLNFYSIVWEDETISSNLSKDMITRWIDEAERLQIPSIDKEKVSELVEQAKIKREQLIEARKKQMKKDQDTEDTIKEKINSIQPSWAKAVIVAELEIDDCDTMSDYFNTKTKKEVIIGFSKHTRNLFPELRKAAGHFEPTQSLKDADKSAEHRENYSMGKGTYLKDGNSYSSGWMIKKYDLDFLRVTTKTEIAEHLLKKESSAVNNADKSIPVTLIKNGSKPGFIEYHFNHKPSQEILSELKKAGFRWSSYNKCWYGRADQKPNLYNINNEGNDNEI